MPNVQINISGVELTEKLVTSLEQEITSTLRDTISESFAIGLGYLPGTSDYAVAYKHVQEIMPGWTWINVSASPWALRQVHIEPNDAIVGHVRILLLADAVTKDYRQKVVADVFQTVKNILGISGKKLHLFIDVIEGEVDMTLDTDLFGTLLNGQDHKLLKVSEVVDAIKHDIINKISSNN
jgi:hypothetical protein